MLCIANSNSSPFTLKNFCNKYDTQYLSLCKNNCCNCKEEVYMKLVNNSKQHQSLWLWFGIILHLLLHLFDHILKKHLSFKYCENTQELLAQNTGFVCQIIQFVNPAVPCDKKTVMQTNVCGTCYLLKSTL